MVPVRKELIDVSVIDSHQLMFRFSKPSFSGLEKIAHHPIIAQHIWQSIEDPIRFENPTPVGTGPFTEVKRFEGQVWELERNPYSWTKPKVQALRFPAFSSNEQATLALLNDEVDWAANFIPVVGQLYDIYQLYNDALDENTKLGKFFKDELRLRTECKIGVINRVLLSLTLDALPCRDRTSR